MTGAGEVKFRTSELGGGGDNKSPQGPQGSGGSRRGAEDRDAQDPAANRSEGSSPTPDTADERELLLTPAHVERFISLSATMKKRQET